MAEDLREWWSSKREELQQSAMGSNPLVSGNRVFVASPSESLASPPALDANHKRDFMKERRERAEMCTREGVRAGVKAGAIAAVVSAVPVLVGARVIPWAQRNLNYTAQALLISAATIAAYFIVSDQTILECARSSSYKAIEADRLKPKSDYHA